MFIDIQFVEIEQEIIIDSLESSEVLDVDFSEIDVCIDVEFGEVQEIEKLIGGELYEGAYSVTPKTTEQTLKTAQKVLTDDVTIRSIPFYDVGNASGGVTVYIAREI